MHIFAYGSLLSPDSLRATVPGADIGACIPARISGFLRCFDVGFPNDGSHTDKAYRDPSGRRPPTVLMCNLRPHPQYAASGVCIPVDDDALARLTDRERRYTLLDVTGRVAAYPPDYLPGHVPGPVFAFVGAPEFAPATGVVSRDYLRAIVSGSRQWEDRAPEFHHLTMATTEFPDPATIVDLTRVDL